MKIWLTLITAVAISLTGASIAQATAPASIPVLSAGRVTVNSNSPSLGEIQIPGVKTRTIQVANRDVPSGRFAGSSSALVSTIVPNAGISGYKTKYGSQILIKIKSDTAPSQYSFKVSANHLQLRGNGSVLATDARGDAVGWIAAPWAVDARGQAVPTHFTVAGNLITQVVDFSARTAFPFVADPSW